MTGIRLHLAQRLTWALANECMTAAESGARIKPAGGSFSHESYREHAQELTGHVHEACQRHHALLA